MTKEEQVGRFLEQRHLTLAVAESCTGGLIAHRVTSVPGSSAYFPGGIVAYANEVKTRMLGIEEGVLATCGAVSQEVAAMMAAGVRERFGTDIGVGVTGIAGPGGGTDEKPVGLVYIAASSGDDALVQRFSFEGNRLEIKRQASDAALDMILRLGG
jgi:nicotinamide-nucleotide amidase